MIDRSGAEGLSSALIYGLSLGFDAALLLAVWLTTRLGTRRYSAQPPPPEAPEPQPCAVR